MQVYRDLRVLTARPSVAEECRVPHHLFGHVDAAVNYSVGHYVADAARILAELPADTLPIFVGGTGLYFKALIGGLAAIPPIDPVIREGWRERLARDGVEALHAELSVRDPGAASRIMLRDRSRILRALEVLDATGRPIADWHRDGMPPVVDADHAIKHFPPPGARCELIARIEARFATMLQAGALDEVRALAARHLPDTLPAMKAHGVPWLRRYFDNEISLDEAAAGAIMDTRRYAKRQVTWFRNQMPGWTWVAPEEGMAAAETLMQT